MRFRTKVAIFLTAILLTLVGFNAVASPCVEILKVGKRAGHGVIATVVAKEAAVRTATI